MLSDPIILTWCWHNPTRYPTLFPNVDVSLPLCKSLPTVRGDTGRLQSRPRLELRAGGRTFDRCVAAWRGRSNSLTRHVCP